MKRFISCLVLAGFCLAASIAFASDLKISGFGQWWYYYTDAGTHGTSEFTMKRMRFKPSYQMTDKVGFFTQFDFKVGNPSVHLLDALLDVKLAPWLKLRAGQFTIPFGIETPVSPFNLDCISYSYLVGSGEPTEIGFFPGLRDVGLQVRGIYDPVNYAVAVMNGKGLTGGEDNKFKNIAGRFGFGKKGVGAGISGFFGFDNALVGLDTLGNAIYDPDSLWNTVRFGGDLKVDIANVLLKGEFAMGSHGVADDSTMGQMGYYVLLGYTIPIGEYGPKDPGYMALQPIVRFDAWDGDTDTDDDGLSRITAGANFWFDKNAKVSAFYEVRTEEWDDGPKDDRFRLQLGLAW